MKYLAFYILFLFFNGCSIKPNEPLEQKVIKHTINSPLYVVIGIGAIAKEGSDLIIITTLAIPYYAYKNISSEFNSSRDEQK